MAVFNSATGKKAGRTVNGRRDRAFARAFTEVLEARRLLSLSAPVTYNTGTTPDIFVPNAAPIGVVSADINGDGKLDLIVAHTADNSIYYLQGNGDGTFKPAVQIPVGQAFQGDVFVDDFNHDKKLDLLVIGTNDEAVVLLGNGDGTFQAAKSSSSFNYSGYYPRGWVVGDFNNDGNLDIAFTLPSESTNTGRYGVLLGNGDGTFQSAIIGPAVLGYSRWVATGFFNQDGNLDLVTADGQGTSGDTANVEMTVLLGNGDGTFTLGGHYASPQFPDGTDTSATSNPEDVVVADVNGDGKPDVIESDYDNTINVFIGNGDGTFQAARSIDPGNYPRDVDVVDVNGDGHVDLVVTNVGINTGGALQSTDGDEPGSVAVLLGNGDGSFQAPITYSPSVYPGWTAVGDFNGDKHPDLAVTQVLNGSTVKVMLNQPTSTNLPPYYVNPPSASPDVVTNNTTVLSALGADDGGESKLTYTWSTVGSIPGPVTYSINGTNASKNTTVTFTTPGTYLFQCAATDAQGLSIMDLATVTVNAVTTTLPAPVAVGQGTTTTPGPQLNTANPTFQWDAVTGVTGLTGYQINVENLTASTFASYQVGTSVTSYNPPAGELIPGDSYVWNVRVLVGTTTGPESAYLNFQVPPAVALPAPVAVGQGTTATPGPQLNTANPTFQWDAVTGVTGLTGYQINVENLTANTFASYQVGTSVTSYNPPTGELIPGDSYVWNVRILVGTTTGPESAYLNFTVPPAVTLPAPVATGQGSTTSPGPKLSPTAPPFEWDAVTGVTGLTGYQINVENVTTNTFASYQVGATATSYTPTAGTLIAGDTYEWNVRILVGTTSGPPSTYLYFTVPAAVTLPAPVATGQGTTTSPGPKLSPTAPPFEWDAVTGVTGLTGYQINVENVTANTFASYQVGATATSYTPTAGALIAGDTYEWNVRILVGTQSGPPSTYLFFTVPAAVALPAPVATSPGETTAPGTGVKTLTPTLKWDKVTGVTGLTGYQIYLTDLTLNKTLSYQVGASVHTFIVPAGALTAGDDYVWNVRVLVGTQSGPPSTYLYFKIKSSATAAAASAPNVTSEITADSEKLTRLEDEQHETVRSLKAATPGTSAYTTLMQTYDEAEKRIKSVKNERAALESEI